jgi:predicted HTH transcriptional regulator
MADARNPLIAEPLYRIKYVEKAGTGTPDMIADCRQAGLPGPISSNAVRI